MIKKMRGNYRVIFNTIVLGICNAKIANLVILYFNGPCYLNKNTAPFIDKVA